jgi:hypothetical protein
MIHLHQPATENVKSYTAAAEALRRGSLVVIDLPNGYLSAGWCMEQRCFICLRVGPSGATRKTYQYLASACMWVKEELAADSGKE